MRLWPQREAPQENDSHEKELKANTRALKQAAQRRKDAIKNAHRVLAGIDDLHDGVLNMATGKD